MYGPRVGWRLTRKHTKLWVDVEVDAQRSYFANNVVNDLGQHSKSGHFEVGGVAVMRLQVPRN